MPRKPSRGQRAFRLPRSSLRSDTCKWSIDLFAAKREEFTRKEPLSRPFGRGDSSRSAALSSPLRARGTRPSNRSGHDHRDCKRRRFGGNSYERTEPTENRTRAANATTGKWAAPANVCDNPVNHVDPSGFYSGFSSADEFGPREGAATALGGFSAEVGIGVALGSSSAPDRQKGACKRKAPCCRRPSWAGASNDEPDAASLGRLDGITRLRAKRRLGGQDGVVVVPTARGAAGGGVLHLAHILGRAVRAKGDLKRNEI